MRINLLVLTLVTAFTLAAQQAAAGVDAIVELIQAKMSESLILKQLQREGKAYNLTAADMLKLQKAGASEKIIEAMMDPGSAAKPAAPATAPLAASPVATPETPVAAAPATPQEQKKSSRFSGFGNRLKQAGKRSVDSTTSGIEKSTEKTISSAETSVDRTIDNSQQKVDKKVDGAVGAPAQQVDKATSKTK